MIRTLSPHHALRHSTRQPSTFGWRRRHRRCRNHRVQTILSGIQRDSRRPLVGGGGTAAAGIIACRRSLPRRLAALTAASNRPSRFLLDPTTRFLIQPRQGPRERKGPGRAKARVTSIWSPAAGAPRAEPKRRPRAHSGARSRTRRTRGTADRADPARVRSCSGAACWGALAPTRPLDRAGCAGPCGEPSATGFTFPATRPGASAECCLRRRPTAPPPQQGPVGSPAAGRKIRDFHSASVCARRLLAPPLPPDELAILATPVACGRRTPHRPARPGRAPPGLETPAQSAWSRVGDAELETDESRRHKDPPFLHGKFGWPRDPGPIRGPQGGRSHLARCTPRPWAARAGVRRVGGAA